MKHLALLFSLIFSIPVWANNIIVNGTRFIYPGNEKEITVQLSNTADRPALAQAWLDNGDASATPDTITTPFIITPPISRVDGRSGQTLRIKLANNSGLSTTKESLWWLNILEIPPVVAGQKNEGSNILQLAIRSRFKFIYRPTGLGNRDTAAEQLVLTHQAGGVSITNPTPFYITVTRISRAGGKALNQHTAMVAPQSSQTVPLSAAVTAGETLTINNINDYGADVAVKTAVR
ncbi:molecular chaperone [Shimwellia pseudoproteus]|uniref:fimbrial biogenesis chaperone n=1 Tax=Shimwellia pseudoproteus TaxID=570012 RepID=UPI0018EC8689|nr:molecular chaperone [Shimwellia pseudoproteus]MBJ3816716.1 molecular chaperone [Shimwellia pseudoproteus]